MRDAANLNCVGLELEFNTFHRFFIVQAKDVEQNYNCKLTAIYIIFTVFNNF
jgi:hypothetical protein